MARIIEIEAYSNKLTSVAAARGTTYLHDDGVFDEEHWYYHVDAVDADGNVSLHSIRFDAITPDTTPPDPPVISSSTHPVTTEWYFDNNPQLEWVASDTSGVDNYSWTLNQVSLGDPGTTPMGNINTTSYTGVADGTWYFHVRARNTAGLWSETAHFAVNADITPPDVQTVGSTTHPIETTWYALNDPEFFWSSTDDAPIIGYSYSLNNASTTTPDQISEGIDTDASFIDVVDGIWYFHVRALNATGRWGDPVHFKVQIDMGPQAPVVSSSTHPVETTWYNHNDPEFTWTCFSYSGIAGYSYEISGLDSTVPDETSDSATPSMSYSDVADGELWFHVRGLSGSGVWGPTAHYRVRVDTGPQAPVITSPTHPTPGVWVNNNDPVFNWSAQTASGQIIGYSYVLDQVADTDPDYNSEGAGNTKSFTDVADGSWYFHVRAQSVSEAWGSVAHFQINVDTGPTLPVVTSNTHPNQDLYYVSKRPDFEWNATSWSGVKGYSWTLDAYSDTEPDNASEGTGEYWLYEDGGTNELEPGIYYFHVKAQNNINNWGVTAHFRVRVNGPPVIQSASNLRVVVKIDNTEEQEATVRIHDPNGAANVQRVGLRIKGVDQATSLDAMRGNLVWSRTNTDPVLDCTTAGFCKKGGYGNDKIALSTSSSSVNEAGNVLTVKFRWTLLPNYGDVQENDFMIVAWDENVDTDWQEYDINFYSNAQCDVSANVSPAHNAWVATHYPDFESTVSTDPNALDEVWYLFRIATGSDGETGVVAESPWMVASGGTPTWTLPAGSGPNGNGLENGFYYWHVYTKDTWGWVNGPGSVTKFKVDGDAPLKVLLSAAPQVNPATWYPNNDSTITWDFTSYSGIDQFEYWMDDTTPHQTVMGTVTTVDYTNLEDGLHTFHIMAHSVAGMWSEVYLLDY